MYRFNLRTKIASVLEAFFYIFTKSCEKQSEIFLNRGRSYFIHNGILRHRTNLWGYGTSSHYLKWFDPPLPQTCWIHEFVLKFNSNNNNAVEQQLRNEEFFVVTKNFQQ